MYIHIGIYHIKYSVAQTIRTLRDRKQKLGVWALLTGFLKYLNGVFKMLRFSKAPSSILLVKKSKLLLFVRFYET